MHRKIRVAQSLSGLGQVPNCKTMDDLWSVYVTVLLSGLAQHN